MAFTKDYVADISRYIKKNIKKGYTKESLKFALLNQGYSRQEIEKAFKKADQELAEEAPELKVQPKITYEIIEPKEYAMKHVVNKRSFWKRLFGID